MPIQSDLNPECPLIPPFRSSSVRGHVLCFAKGGGQEEEELPLHGHLAAGKKLAQRRILRTSPVTDTTTNENSECFWQNLTLKVH